MSAFFKMLKPWMAIPAIALMLLCASAASAATSKILCADSVTPSGCYLKRTFYCDMCPFPNGCVEWICK